MTANISRLTKLRVIFIAALQFLMTFVPCQFWPAWRSAVSVLLFIQKTSYLIVRL